MEEIKISWNGASCGYRKAKKKFTGFVPYFSAPFNMEIAARIKELIDFWFWRDPGVSFKGRISRLFLSNHVGFTHRLLDSSTQHSPESFTHLKTG